MSGYGKDRDPFARGCAITITVLLVAAALTGLVLTSMFK